MAWMIVSDSSCEIRELENPAPGVQFALVPFKIRVGEREYVDLATLNTQQMLQAMTDYNGASTTACPSPEEWAEYFLQADNVFAFTISSNLAGSDNAAKLAFGLAEKQQAELTLYHCCGVPSRGFTTNVTDTRSGSLEQPDEAYQEMVREELNTAYAYQIEACTRPFRMELSVGMPSTEILRYARQIKPDLIVMGASSAASDPNAARMRSIVGNTVRAVAKKAPCPVLIVNRPCTTCWHLFSNIVFCTDFSEAANHAFRFALNTARQLNAKLYITHAVDITSIQGMTMDQSEIERHAEQMREKIDKLYLSKLDGFANAEVIVREGIPYVEILKVARENEADLIVMAHHSSDLSDDDADIGSTVEQVVLRSACPVASVTRPEAR